MPLFLSKSNKAERISRVVARTSKAVERTTMPMVSNRVSLRERKLRTSKRINQSNRYNPLK